MKKIINATYSKLDPRVEIYDRLLSHMVGNKSDFEFLYYNQFRSEFYVLIFDENELIKCKEHFKNDKEVTDFINLSFEEKGSICTHCGCVIINALPYTYRDHGGCIGRSYECPECSCLTNKKTYKVYNKYVECGSEKAVELLLKFVKLAKRYRFLDYILKNTQRKFALLKSLWRKNIMAHIEWCGKPCCECSGSHCELDTNIPCSPDCENLNADGTRNEAECRKENCDAVLQETDTDELKKKLEEIISDRKKCRSLADAFFENIATDSEPNHKIGKFMIKAYLENNVDDFLISICGWGMESLVNLMKDSDSEDEEDE